MLTLPAVSCGMLDPPLNICKLFVLYFLRSIFSFNLHKGEERYYRPHGSECKLWTRGVKNFLRMQHLEGVHNKNFKARWKGDGAVTFSSRPGNFGVCRVTHRAILICGLAFCQCESSPARSKITKSLDLLNWR